MNQSEYLNQGMLRRGRVRYFVIFHLFFLIFLWGEPAMARWMPQMCQTTTITASTPTADFVDNGDGTVTHSKTGLMWKRCSEGQVWNGTTCAGAAARYSWQGGLQQAEVLNNTGGFATFTNWRLPNIKELNSVVEVQCTYPAINATIFPSIGNGVYWSASPYSADATKAWFVQFFNAGFVEVRVKSWFGYILLVRDR